MPKNEIFAINPILSYMRYVILPLIFLALFTGLYRQVSAQAALQYAVVTVEFEKPEFSFTSKYHEANRELAKMDEVGGFFYSEKLKAFAVEVMPQADLQKLFTKLGRAEVISIEKYNYLKVNQLAYKIASDINRYLNLLPNLPTLPSSLAEKVSVLEVYLINRPELVENLLN